MLDGGEVRWCVIGPHPAFVIAESHVHSPYRFNPKLTDRTGKEFTPADNICAFIERLPHVKGPLAGQPIRLEPWQVFILTTVFGWVKPNGKRRFRRCYVEVPRGNGKSAISSAVGLYIRRRQLSWPVERQL